MGRVGGFLDQLLRDCDPLRLVFRRVEQFLLTGPVTLRAQLAGDVPRGDQGGLDLVGLGLRFVAQLAHQSDSIVELRRQIRMGGEGRDGSTAVFGLQLPSASTVCRSRPSISRISTYRRPSISP